jgi:hypothetical protein
MQVIAMIEHRVVCGVTGTHTVMCEYHEDGSQGKSQACVTEEKYRGMSQGCGARVSKTSQGCITARCHAIDSHMDVS